jgi:Fe-S-cluster-containing dehydrogenase component
VNDGVARLREIAAFELTCRRCDVRSCATACPNDALEIQEDGCLKRYNMRCTGCLSCSHACPFGNIIPAALQFYDNHCDFCARGGVSEPLCVATCPYDAVRMEEVSADEENLHVVSEMLAVRSLVWTKEEPAETT